MGQLYGPTDPAAAAGWEDHPPRKGFFTDTSICIGCKACEVACKTWNAVPEDGLNLLGLSYDNTGGLSADTWRHVAFIEQRAPLGHRDAGILPTTTAAVPAVPTTTTAVPVVPTATTTAAATATATVDLGLPGSGPPGAQTGAEGRGDFRWLMSSDVCKHCTHAACLDVCPTGALFRTEFGTVVVQEDICNGCGYCIPACPYGVIGKREDDGRAWKCTLCYDRISHDMTPACAQACPTQSIQFGDLDELRERAAGRVATLHEAGVTSARLYGEDENDGVGGAGALFLLLDEPEVYGLPPDPVVTTRDLPSMYRRAGTAAGLMLLAAVAVFAGEALAGLVGDRR